MPKSAPNKKNENASKTSKKHTQRTLSGAIAKEQKEEKKPKPRNKQWWAKVITWCGRGENETGMQMVGTMAKKGLSVSLLKEIQKEERSKGVLSDYYDLGTLLTEEDLKAMGVEKAPEAGVLVLRGALSDLIGENDAWMKVEDELEQLEEDKYAKMRGTVNLKSCRWNCLLAETSQQPDYPAGEGTIHDVRKYEYLDRVRHVLSELVHWPLGPKVPFHVGEINHYFDCNECGIGWHGDAERRVVVGTRHGPGTIDMPLKWVWMTAKHEKQIVDGEETTKKVKTYHGKEQWIFVGRDDVYIMSEEAVGTDWKKFNKPVLLHSSGYGEKNKYSTRLRPATGLGVRRERLMRPGESVPVAR